MQYEWSFLSSICQLVDLMKLQLSAFGVQIVPFLSIGDTSFVCFFWICVLCSSLITDVHYSDNLPHLSYLSMTALPWGLAALGVFTGFKVLLVPIQVEI